MTRRPDPRNNPGLPPRPQFIVVQPAGNWHGRGMDYDPDRQIIEQERQQWVYEKVDGMNEIITDLAFTDPDREYARLRKEYEDTGNETALRLALEYVRP